MIALRTWYKKPPPHIGWWNASTARLHYVWRWWNGQNWSLPVHENAPLDEVEYCVKIKDDPVYEMEWSDYYPENARVPRISP